MAIRSLYCNPLIATEDDQYLVATPSMHQTTTGGNFPVIIKAILISFAIPESGIIYRQFVGVM